MREDGEAKRPGSAMPGGAGVGSETCRSAPPPQRSHRREGIVGEGVAGEGVVEEGVATYTFTLKGRIIAFDY